MPEGIEGKDLVAQTRSNTELHLSTYHTEDFPKYSYDDFMQLAMHQLPMCSGVWKPDAIIFPEKMNCLDMRENSSHI